MGNESGTDQARSSAVSETWTDDFHRAAMNGRRVIILSSKDKQEIQERLRAVGISLRGTESYLSKSTPAPETEFNSSLENNWPLLC